MVRQAQEWYENDEARRIFDAATPDATNPSDQHIEGDVLCGPNLMLKISVSLAALMVIGITSMGMLRRATPLLLVAFASAGLLIAPLIIYADTIIAVSDIVE
ncbi:MAG: hypothetical protein WB239_12985 [Acidimicrobiia bacterium]